MFFSLRNNSLKNYRDFELLNRNVLLLKNTIFFNISKFRLYYFNRLLNLRRK